VGWGGSVVVGTVVGAGVRVGGFFEAAATDDVPLASISMIRLILKSETPTSDNL